MAAERVDRRGAQIKYTAGNISGRMLCFCNGYKSYGGYFLRRMGIAAAVGFYSGDFVHRIHSGNDPPEGGIASV